MLAAQFNGLEGDIQRLPAFHLPLISIFTSNTFLTFLLQVVKQLKELQDSQELVKQLQIQLDEQVC